MIESLSKAVICHHDYILLYFVSIVKLFLSQHIKFNFFFSEVEWTGVSRQQCGT